MELSLRPFFLYQWDPVLFYRGRVYLVGQGQEDGCLVAYNKRLSLVKLGNIEVYENTFLDHEKEQIEAYQKDFLERTVQKEFKENDAAQKELAENEILSFIVRDVLPALTQQNEKKEIDSLLGVEETEKNKKTALLSDIISDVTVKEDASIIIDSWIKKVEKEYAPKLEKLTPSTDRIDELLRDVNYAPAPSHYVQEQIQDLLSGVSSSKESVERNTDNSIFSSVLTDSSSIGVFGGRVFKLAPYTQEYPLSAYIGRRRHSFQWYQPLNELYKQYEKALEKKFKIDALRNNASQSTALAQAQRERQALRELLKTNNFEKAGVGFQKHDGHYYVYIETPDQYALQSPETGHYYLFQKARIGVALTKERRIYASSPVVMNSYRHPFLSGSSSFNTICLGNYSYDSTRRLQPLESVLKFLGDAKKVILAGYGTGSNPYNRLDTSSFKQISEDKIKQENIPVTNKGVVQRRWK